MVVVRHSREGGNLAGSLFTRSHEGDREATKTRRTPSWLRSSSCLRAGIFAIVASLTIQTPALAQEKQPPYWASIASGKAMTRNGPARTYPGKWLYERRDLPVRILQKYQNWRLIQDPDGAKGWMLVTLLSDRRTVIVEDGDPRPIYSDPNANSRVRYRAEAGVVGRIDHCKSGWCHINFGGREGFVQTSDVWGVDPNEVVD